MGTDGNGLREIQEADLRRVAPPFVPRGQHRRALRSALRSDLQHHRRRPVLPVAGGLGVVAAVTLVFLWGQRSGGDRLELGPGDTSVPPLSGYLSSTGPSQAAGPEVLTAAEGWTIQGKTIFLATYTAVVAGEAQTLRRIADFPRGRQSPHHAPFLADHADQMKEQVAAGRARYLGDEDLFVDGAPVRFSRFGADIEGFGHVVYWQGCLLKDPVSVSP